MGTTVRRDPPRPSWWDQNGEGLCLVAAIVCAMAGFGVIGLVTFWPW